MPPALKASEAELRRSTILKAARWCFLNFGFAKTSFEDIARRAGLSRTLLYRTFRDREDIYRAVFVDLMVSPHAAARAAAQEAGPALERLLTVCRLMVLEPWSEMVGTPMGHEFIEACERMDAETGKLYREAMSESVRHILGDALSTEVFLLSLDGLLADRPSMTVLESRVQLLAARFAL